MKMLEYLFQKISKDIDFGKELYVIFHGSLKPMYNKFLRLLNNNPKIQKKSI